MEWWWWMLEIVLSVYPILESAIVVPMTVVRAIAMESDAVVPAIYIFLAIIEVALSGLYVARKLSRFRYSNAMCIILCFKMMHVYMAPSWGYNLLRRTRVCVHIFGIIYAYLHLCNQRKVSQVLHLGESWLLCAYVVMTTFLFRYHSLLRNAFEGFFKWRNSFIATFEISLMVILVVLAVLLVIELGNKRVLSAGLLAGLLIINGIVDGRVRYWTGINKMDISTVLWFIASNIPPFVALLHTAVSKTNYDKSH